MSQLFGDARQGEGPSVWYTEKFPKIYVVHATAWYIGHEDVVKIKKFLKS
jgi:hypothetical protein